MEQTPHTRSEESKAFIFVAVVLFPLLSVAIVGGLGFSIWIAQMIFGPPSA